MMKIAIIQFQPKFADIYSNIQLVHSFLEKSKDAELVILPELANTGYNFENRAQARALAGLPEKSEYVEMLTGLAKQNEQMIVSGFNEHSGETLFNSSLLITKKGIVGKYRKVHLFMNEKSIFEPGDLGFPVFNINGVKMGMLICFDYLFAEAWRIMALKGVDIIAHPSNLITENAFRVVPAQAVMNRIYIITANRTGTERDITFNGKSFAVDPSGNIIKRASGDADEILSFEIEVEKARDKFITPLNHVLEDRIPEKYTELIKQ
jgi:predicted amidohydrolase